MAHPVVVRPHHRGGAEVGGEQARGGDLDGQAAGAGEEHDGADAARLCTKSFDVIFTAAGGGAIYESNPLQRAWRDIHAANAHFGVNWDANGVTYGRVALGLSADSANL